MSEEKKVPGSAKIQKVLGSHAKKLKKTVGNVKDGLAGEDVDETTESLDYEEALGELAASEKRRRILLAVGAIVILIIIAIAVFTGMKLHSQARVNSVLNQLDGTTWVYKHNESSTQWAKYRSNEALFFTLSESTGAMQCKSKDLENSSKNQWSDVVSHDAEIVFDGNTALLDLSPTVTYGQTVILTFEVALNDADEVQSLVGPIKISCRGSDAKWAKEYAEEYAENYEKTKNSGRWVKTKTAFVNLTVNDFQETNRSNSSSRSSN